jgi:hypothetical protein
MKLLDNIRVVNFSFQANRRREVSQNKNLPSGLKAHEDQLNEVWNSGCLNVVVVVPVRMSTNFNDESLPLVITCQLLLG